jgi:hypothetical protein
MTIAKTKLKRNTGSKRPITKETKMGNLPTVSSKRPKAIGTMRRLMILNGIGRFAQFTRMALVSGLGAAGLGLLAPPFSIRRWRFG